MLGLFVLLKQRAPRAGKYKLSGSLFASTGGAGSQRLTGWEN